MPWHSAERSDLFEKLIPDLLQYVQHQRLVGKIAAEVFHRVVDNMPQGFIHQLLPRRKFVILPARKQRCKHRLQVATKYPFVFLELNAHCCI